MGEEICAMPRYLSTAQDPSLPREEKKARLIFVVPQVSATEHYPGLHGWIFGQCMAQTKPYRDDELFAN